MTAAFEGGFLARRRESQGEGEGKRIAERVNAFDDKISRDVATLASAGNPELKAIGDEAKALAEKTRGKVATKLREWAGKNTTIKLVVASVGIHAAMLAPRFSEHEQAAPEVTVQAEKDWSDAEIEAITETKHPIALDESALLRIVRSRPELLHKTLLTVNLSRSASTEEGSEMLQLYELVKKDAPERTDLLDAMTDKIKERIHSLGATGLMNLDEVATKGRLEKILAQ